MEKFHRGRKAHLNPVGFDVRKIAEEKSCDGDGAENVFFARLVQHDALERIVLRGIHAGDEEKSGFVLHRDPFVHDFLPAANFIAPEFSLASVESVEVCVLEIRGDLRDRSFQNFCDGRIPWR